MESTGVFWKPIYNLLEGEIPISLVNAQHIKAVPGRKTDVKDAEWIADLLQHCLLKASFVPPRPQRELRDLMRYRSALIADRARLVTRIHKILEDTNLKITAVITDITGVSGRAILGALLCGETDPQVLADLACRRLRGKRDQLLQAVQGELHESHRLLLSTQLRHLDFLDQQVDELDQAIAKRLGVPYAPRKRPRLLPQACAQTPTTGQLCSPCCSVEKVPCPQGSFLSEAAAIVLLDQIPGVSGHLAQVIVAELGTDMSRFPSEAHLASWAGLCPAAKISAGKRLSTKTGKGNVWLRQALIQAAHGAAHTKGTYLGAYYQRLFGHSLTPLTGPIFSQPLGSSPVSSSFLSLCSSSLLLHPSDTPFSEEHGRNIFPNFGKWHDWMGITLCGVGEFF